ncbi:MAG: hypothetical protein AAB815_01455 [Patescibacteria group bacterium]
MSSGNIHKRILDLLATILKMVQEGTRDPSKVAAVLQSIVDEARSGLRRIFETETLPVPATNGTRIFANSGFVIGYIDPGYKPQSGATPPTEAAVYEMTEESTYAQIFGRVGKDRQRWQNEDQVVAFCSDHRDKLRAGGYGTFFELGGGFVADVHVFDDGRLYVYVYRLSYDIVWHAEDRPRVVLPQVTQ